jgi:hypothetical protein
MHRIELSTLLLALRRTLAITEFAVAGLLLAFGVDGLTMNPRQRIGGDGIATGIWMFMAVPFLLSGLVLMFSAYTAWRGGRRWWAWQAALPALWLAAAVALVVYRIATD